jgi:protein OS-9
MSDDMVLSYVVIILLLLGLHGTIGDRLRPSQSAGDVVHSVQDPKYKIEFHSIDSPVLPTPEQETIMMTDRDGKKFRCNLPLPESTHDVKEEQQNGSSIGLTADDRSTRKTPEDLLEALKEKCFRRFEGWWIYELCYKTRLRQFHIHDKKVGTPPSFLRNISVSNALPSLFPPLCLQILIHSVINSLPARIMSILYLNSK